MPYISGKIKQKEDRDLLLRGEKLKKATEAELKKRPFRNMFIEKKDSEIVKIVWTYFSVIKEKWPVGWEKDPDDLGNKGCMLNKTNGIKAFMRFLGPVYLSIRENDAAKKLKQAISDIFEKITLREDDFTINRFKPGTSGESLLFNELKKQAKLE